jgi:hypothetical protein
VEWLQTAYQAYQRDHALNAIQLTDIKIPYSILVSVKVRTDIDIYDAVEVTQEIET